MEVAFADFTFELHTEMECKVLPLDVRRLEGFFWNLDEQHLGVPGDGWHGPILRSCYLVKIDMLTWSSGKYAWIESHMLHVWNIYLHLGFGVNVGKYSSTMEHLGIERINSSATYFGYFYPLLTQMT